MSLIRSFQRYNAVNRLFGEDDSVLIAVSGGIDSMTLLHIMSKLEIKGAVAHCNFSLRDAESDGDESFVEQQTERLGYRFHSIRFETREYAQATGKSIQMAARDLRYDWFKKLCREYGYTRIALAHNLNDRIETCLINMTRGTGITGLAGMQPQNGDLIRPLLFATRAEITDYAEQNAVSHREDSSNNKDYYTRNFLRHNIIPPLKEHFPAFERTMAENMDRFSDIAKWYRVSLQSTIDKIVHKTDNSQYVDIEDLLAAPSPRLILYEWLKDYGFSNDISNTIISTLDGISGKQFISATHRLVCDRKTLILGLVSDEEGVSYKIGEDDESMDFPISFKMSSIQITPDYKSEASPWVAHVDRDKLQFPLVLRHWCKGDSFCPLGMNTRKKLSDFFIDEKLSIIEKEKVWLICSQDDIVWVSGFRIDNRYKITGETTTVLRIQMM